MPELKLQGAIESIGSSVALFTIHTTNGTPLLNTTLSASSVKIVDHQLAMLALTQWLQQHGYEEDLIAIGHRIVHGGPVHFKPERVTPALLESLEKLIPLAPLHQPHNLNAVKLLTKLNPETPQIACFDTGFHHTQTDIAQMFALPKTYLKEGIRRYGFHGLSYEYITSVLPQFLSEKAKGRIVIAHLGNGASMCAIESGKSIASTMGFTALDGLPMGTRCGTIDPGVILYLLQQKQMSADEVSNLLYKQSGLKGVSGLSHDMRELLAANTQDAKTAIDLFCYRINRELGSLVAALGGLDAIVFTGGIGEYAADIRTKVCNHAAWARIEINETANQNNEILISNKDSPISAWVINTDEELMIAKHALNFIQQ